MTDKTKLQSLLNKINWLYKSFEENNFENVSALEKALLKEKVLMFYDEVENLSTKIQKEKIEVVNEPIIENTKRIEEKPKNIIPEQVRAVKENIVEDKPIEKKLIEKNEEITKPVIEKPVQKQIEKIEEKPIDKLVGLTSPIKDNTKEISKNTEANKEKFQKSEAFNKQISMPKRDMREIIDLNKSFIFKAELFKQNNDLYNQFINEMNTTRTEDDAFSVMINWTEKLHWNTEENKAYDLLLRSVEKRFLPLI